jgi:hypothetical protein
MSVAIHELETSQPHYEVSVDTAEEVLLLHTGLNRVIAEQLQSQAPDEKVLQEAEALRSQLGGDVIKIVGRAAVGNFKYEVDDDTIIRKVLDTTEQENQPVVVAQKAVQQTPSSSGGAPRHIIQQRITNWHDPRLDRKPSRWPFK